jgi:corrinoid protein of di/trimethylamine methyltransferase
MMGEKILEQICKLVAEGEEDEAVKAVNAAFDAGLDAITILNEGAAKGMEIVGDQYTAGEAFLPELVLAGDAMSAVVKVIFSHMSAADIAKNRHGVVVIGQASGDVHDVGKNIVAALLAVNGFEVHDLGIDVPVKRFFEKAIEVKADIVGISTLLTTSLPYLDDTVRYIRDTGNRDKFFFIVGGGPVTPSFAEKIGADGWARNALDAVQLCQQLVERGNPGKNGLTIVDGEAQPA